MRAKKFLSLISQEKPDQPDQQPDEEGPE